MHCRSCDSPLTPFMSFGRQPIANGFLAREQIPNEHFYEMEVAVCPRCSLFQLIEQPAPETMFHADYAFFSQTSRGMQDHFEAFAKWVMAEKLKDPQPFVVELGSNDGIMLRHFVAAGVRSLGVEPSANVAAAARKIGVDTVSEFFSAEFARRLKAERGPADALLGANVMCHIPAIRGIAEGAAELLKPEGLLIFEDPYLGDVIEKTSYDQIYDEHVFLFSVRSVAAAFAPFGLSVVDVLPQSTHGGSMRYVLGRPAYHQPSPRVAAQIAHEAALGLERPETYERFRQRCEASRDALKRLLVDLKRQGKRVVGYGATSKSTTIMCYSGVTPELIEFISDTTPTKQNKLSPGAHIPVLPPQRFWDDYPDYAVLFAWNHAKEIMARETDFVARGGKWIVHVPEVRVL